MRILVRPYQRLKSWYGQRIGRPESGVIATHSGLRGRPGTDLSDALVSRVVRGFVEHLRQEGLPATLGLARDERPAGEPLAALVSATATAAGADVVDFGVISTPAAKLAARRRGPRGGGGGDRIAPRAAPERPQAGQGSKLRAARRAAARAPRGWRRRRRAPRPRAARGHRWLRSTPPPILAAVDTDAIRAAGLRVRIAGGAGEAGALLLEPTRRSACWLAPGSRPAARRGRRPGAVDRRTRALARRRRRHFRSRHSPSTPATRSRAPTRAA